MTAGLSSTELDGTELDDRIAAVRAARRAGAPGRDGDFEIGRLLCERAERRLSGPECGAADIQEATADLQESRELLRGVIAAGAGTDHLADLDARLVLGLCCAYLYDLRGEPEIAEEAITALRVVVPLLLLVDPPQAAWFGWMLAELLADRSGGDPEGSELTALRRLTEADNLLDMALRHAAPEYPEYNDLLADARALKATVAVPLWACDDTLDGDQQARRALRRLLTDAVLEVPAGHPRRWLTCADLAELCHEDYWASSDRADLEQAVQCWEAALAGARAIGEPPADVLAETASALDTRFWVDPEAGGAPADRDRAIALFTEAFSLAEEPAASHLAMCGLLHLRRGGESATLDDDEPDPGAVADIGAAVRHLSGSLGRGSSGEPWYRDVTYCHALAVVMNLDLTEAAAEVADRAIVDTERTLAGFAPGDPEWLMLTAVNAQAHTKRFTWSYQAGSLLPAIELLGAALRQAGADHPDRRFATTVLVRATVQAHATGLVSTSEKDATTALLDEWGDDLGDVEVGQARLLDAFVGAATGTLPSWQQPASRLRALARDLPRQRGRFRGLAGMSLTLRYQHTGSVRDLTTALAHLRRTIERARPGSVDHSETVVLLALASTMGLLRGWAPDGQPVEEAAAAVVETIAAVLPQLPPNHPLQALARLMQAAAREQAGEQIGHEQLAGLLEGVDRFTSGTTFGSFPHANLRCAGALSAIANPTRTLTQAQRAVAELRELLEASGDHGRPAARHGLALGLAQLYERDGDPGHLVEAVDQLREALAGTKAGGWLRLDIAEKLATTLRRLADRDPQYGAQSRAAATKALQVRGELATLQADASDAAALGHSSAKRMAAALSWCLFDRAWSDAVCAMEAGRALTLNAAMAWGTVPERLRRAGNGDLAEEWESSGPASGGHRFDPEDDLLPSDLPARVLSALGAVAAEPPAPAEVAAALRELGQHALVYLVPGDADRFGYALFVRSDATTAGTMLPKLVDVPGGVVDHYHGVHDALRAATEPAERARLRRRWLAALDELGTWAWTAAMDVVLTMLDFGGQPARLTLVPVGRLSGLPWHAARERYTDRTFGRPRHAIDRAVISYAASARTMMDCAARPAMPLGRSALLVGNPTGDERLRWAEQEATSLWRSFYPDADYFGAVADLGDSAATAGELIECSHADLLAGLPGGARERPLVHLSCHAGLPAGSRPGSILGARLKLGPGGLALSVAKILRQAAGRPVGAPGPLVDLAGCNTHLTGQVHDEALTLSTAFLVAGASTVLGSQWRVMDRSTALLMFVVHHHLRVTGLPPADALRAAQLWMLDPARRPVDGMPPLFRAAVAEPHYTAPRAWGAFVHQGR